jgi:hypothetical protein
MALSVVVLPVLTRFIDSTRVRISADQNLTVATRAVRSRLICTLAYPAICSNFRNRFNSDCLLPPSISNRAPPRRRAGAVAQDSSKSIPARFRATRLTKPVRLPQLNGVSVPCHLHSPRIMQTGEEPVKVSLRLASLDL